MYNLEVEIDNVRRENAAIDAAIDGEIWPDKIRLTSKGGGIVVYKSTKKVEYRERGKITEFSDNSRKRLAYTASNFSGDWLSMITLTYAKDYPKDGETVKKDLNRFLSLLRKKTRCKYLWFLEFQKRGAPHVHVLTDIEFDKDVSLALSNSWAETVIRGNNYSEEYKKWVYWFNGTTRKSKYGGSEFWQNAKIKGGLSRYTVKYATKMEQKDAKGYANVGRFWGGSRGLIRYTDEIEVTGDLGELISEHFPEKKLYGTPKFIFGSDTLDRLESS